ncbi:hypothetical protein, partial [Paraburkholderia elongata]
MSAKARLTTAFGVLAALTLERSFEDLVPYLLYLLGIGERGAALAEMDPQIRRDRTIDAIIQLLTRESRDQ